MFRNFFGKHKKRIQKIAIILFWILIWQVLAFCVDNSILLVTPRAVLMRLGELLTEGLFWQTVAVSMMRMVIGFLLGLVVAVLLAGVSFRYSMAEDILQPVMSLMKTVPVASFVVMFLIWWGSSVLAVAISFLVVLPNIYISMLEGLKSTDKQLLEMAKIFRIGMVNKMLFIYRPALRPFLNGAMKLALGMCWKSGVAAEVIGTPAFSIGGEIYMSKIHLDTAGVLAWTTIVVLLSLCFERLMLTLTESFFAWTPKIKKRHGLLQEQNGEKEASCLVLDKVCKSYGAQAVVKDKSLVYEKGKVYYLNSPSGSGKTTLLRLLCGLEQPDSGRIEGMKRFSMVFQENRLCEEWNAVQNVALVMGEESKAAEALGRLLETDALIKPCSQLSGGMKRRVALVRAMEADSDMVLLDEPFTGMDAETKRIAEEYIRERQGNRILVIASHI